MKNYKSNFNTPTIKRINTERTRNSPKNNDLDEPDNLKKGFESHQRVYNSEKIMTPLK